MKLLRILRRQRLLALTYFLATLSAVTLTRFDGGVAFLWGSSAILIATLLRTPRRRWAEPVAVCALMNIVVTAVWGLGPALAIPMTVVSCGEALFAAWLLQRHDDRADPMQSLGWFVRFVAIVGIVAPLATGIAAGALLAAATGKDFLTTAVHVFTGHALGSITFTPLALLITGRKAQRETWQVLARRPIDAIAIFSIVFAVTFAVFWQSRMPLLFLPVMVIILATFRLGRVGSAMAVAIVALAGGAVHRARTWPRHPAWRRGFGAHAVLPILPRHHRVDGASGQRRPAQPPQDAPPDPPQRGTLPDDGGT